MVSDNRQKPKEKGQINGLPKSMNAIEQAIQMAAWRDTPVPKTLTFGIFWFFFLFWLNVG